jgi:uncharacterized membrane protein
LQKKSHALKNERQQTLVWVSGIFCMLCSGGLDFLALSYLSQLQIGIFGASALIINYFISKNAFNEKLGTEMTTAVVLLAIGVPLAAYGTHGDSEDVVTLEMFNSAAAATALWVVYSLQAVLAIACVFSTSMLPRAAATGLLGSSMVFFGKYISLVLTTRADSPQLSRACIMAALAVLLHIYFYNLALSKGTAAAVVPLHQSSWVLGCFLYSFIAFSEAIPEETAKRVCVALGCSLCAAAMAIIARTESEQQQSRQNYNSVAQDVM